MRKLIILVCVAGVIGIGMGCDAFRSWEPYESKDGWFGAEFPGSPKVQKIPYNVPPLGSVDLYMFSVELRSGAYAVCYFDFPEEVGANLSSDTLLENMAAGSYNTIGTGRFTKKEIDQDGYTGLETEGEIRHGKTKGVARFRYFMVDGRAFMLQAIGIKSFVSSSDTTRFFDSFKLLEED